jgi:6-phosphofructokinase 1
VAAIAGGADYLMVPEKPFDIEDVCASLKARKARGKDFSILVVAEGSRPRDGALITLDGSKDEFGHQRLGGVGEIVAKEIEKRTGLETRVTILGHVQRGGTPTAFDRLIATRYGLRAVDLVRGKKWGRMVALDGFRMTDVPLPAIDQQKRDLDMDLYKDAEVFFS